MKSKLPSAHGNGLPPHRLTMTIPGGPLRLTDDGERARFHVGKGRAPPPTAVPSLALCKKILVVKLDFIGDWVLTTPFLAALRLAAPQARRPELARLGRTLALSVGGRRRELSADVVRALWHRIHPRSAGRVLDGSTRQRAMA